MAATPPLLSLPDPVGDASGDGSYVLPSAPALRASAFDIRSLNVQNVGGKLQLSVALSGVDNPWQAQSGWSGVVLDIFVKTQSGGRSIMDDLSLSTPGALGWQEHYRLNGFGVQHFRADSQTPDQTAPSEVKDQNKVTVRGTDIVLDTDLSASNSYAYWVTTSVYTPLNASGVLPATGDSGPTSLQSASAGTPAPLDVLLSGDQRNIYLSGTLLPVGQTTDYRALSLLGIAVACLLLTIGLAVVLWRRPG